MKGYFLIDKTLSGHPTAGEATLPANRAEHTVDFRRAAKFTTKAM